MRALEASGRLLVATPDEGGVEFVVEYDISPLPDP